MAAPARGALPQSAQGWHHARRSCGVPPLSRLPLAMKSFRCSVGQVTCFCPRPQRIEGSSFDRPMKLLRDRRQCRGERVKPRPRHHDAKAEPKKSLPPNGLLLRGVAAVMQKVMMNVDLDGTRLGARAAQRRCTAEMLPRLQPAKMRGDHRPDRSLIRGAISVSADVLEDWTDIETCPATNAVKGVALFRIGQEARPMIVEQHHMKLLGTIALTSLSRPAIHRVVTCD